MRKYLSILAILIGIAFLTYGAYAGERYNDGVIIIDDDNLYPVTGSVTELGETNYEWENIFEHFSDMAKASAFGGLRQCQNAPLHVVHKAPCRALFLKSSLGGVHTLLYKFTYNRLVSDNLRVMFEVGGGCHTVQQRRQLCSSSDFFKASAFAKFFRHSVQVRRLTTHVQVLQHLIDS